MLKRPKHTEREEDLLSLQETFFKSKEHCSTKISKTERKDVVAGRPGTRDVVSLQGSTGSGSGSGAGTSYGSVGFNIRQHMPGVLLESVKDREQESLISPSSVLLQGSSDHGFPKPQKLSHFAKKSGGRKSLFAQQYDTRNPPPLSPPQIKDETISRDRIEPLLTEAKEKILNNESNIGDTVMEVDDDTNSFIHSRLITGDGLKCVAGVTPHKVHEELSSIHRENAQRLAAMTEQELLEEKEKMEKTLGPRLVAFLRSRSKAPLPTDPVPQTGSSGPADSSVQSNWLHMDVDESEKTQWMKDVTIDPNKMPEFYRETRFSLTGLVIPRDVGVTIPSHEALHHHGDEPECGGYTLGELSVLALSSVHQQRILALQVVSFIIKRSIHGEYEGVIEGHPLSVLVEFDVLLLFRCALDETPESLQTIAIHGLHCLLVSPAEEYLLSWHHGSSIGHLLPSLTPVKRGGEDAGGDNKVEDVVKNDIVRGLLLMTLLPRLRYILEVCRPQEGTAVKILEILIQISRHSLQSADEVLRCPRLMNFIMTSFLSLNPSNGGDFYVKPHPLAMRLMASLCRAGRYVAKELMTVRNLLPVILSHVLAPLQDHTSSHGAHYLAVESGRAWSVLLGYGLTVETLSDTLMNFLSIFSTSPFALPSHELQRISTLFLVFSSALKASLATPTHPLLSSRVLDHTLKALVRVLREEGDSDKDVSLDIVQYITSLVSIACVYYKAQNLRPELRANPVSLMEEVESVMRGALKLLLSSKLYSFVTKTVTSLLGVLEFSPTPLSFLPSFLSSSLSSKRAIYNRDSMEERDYSVLSHNQSVALVFGDLLSVSQELSLSLSQLHHGVAQDACSLILREENSWIEFMKQFCDTNIMTPSLPYLHIYQCLYSTIKILISDTSLLQNVEKSELCLLHCVSLSLFTSSPLGFESCALDLLKSVIFNPLFYMDEASPTTTPILHSSYLSSVRDTYTVLCGSLVDERDVVRSSFLMNGNLSQVDTQFLPNQIGFVLPSDWPHLPLIARSDEKLMEESLLVSRVTSSLSFVLYLETHRSQFMSKACSSERIMRIMSTFLINSDIFFESAISSSLSSLLCCCYSKPSFLQSVDFSISPSFQEFYTGLLDHFAAVSYGHQIFSAFLLFPLQQKHSLSFRKDFWIDHAHILRLITLTPSQMPIPLDSFLYPVEWEPNLLYQYLKVLASEAINEEHNPLLYHIAVHHVYSAVNSTCQKPEGQSSAATTPDCDEAHRRLKSAVERLPNQSLKRQLISSMEVSHVIS